LAEEAKAENGESDADVEAEAKEEESGVVGGPLSCAEECLLAGNYSAIVAGTVTRLCQQGCKVDRRCRVLMWKLNVLFIINMPKNVSSRIAYSCLNKSVRCDQSS